jgi:hypothetical protein
VQDVAYKGSPPRKTNWSELPQRWALWVLPVLFFVWVDFDGLRTWFAADDFAWLGLLRQIQSGGESIRHALFAPAAQGTIRPWSERGFFLLFESLFGLDSLPFRIWVFLTMAANMSLVAWLTRRLTRSPIAGFFAAILWTANSALSPIVSWTSAYNEVLCAFFLLSAVSLFVRYTETGRTLFWWCQLVVFTLGFGALEINVVYPALAAAWVLFVAPSSKRRALLLSLVPPFCISVAYFLVHRAVAPLPKDGVYAVVLDGRILRTLEIYFKWCFVSPSWTKLGRSTRSSHIVFFLLAVPFAIFVIRQLTKSRHAIVFCLAWFAITLAPMLPIPDHRTDYYVAIPLIGLAMAGGWAFSQAVAAPLPWRAAAAVPLVLYLGGMIPAARQASGWWLFRTSQARTLVLGVEAAHRAHPDKTVVLEAIPDNLYDDVVADSGFFPIGVDRVYLTKDTADNLHPQDGIDRLPDFVLSGEAMRNAITHEQVVIYSVVGDHLRNVTEAWERANFSRLLIDQGAVPRRVEVANPLLTYLLGPEWLPLESDFRWMPGRATVRLGGPQSTADALLLEGYCPEQQLSAGPLHLSVTVDGIPLQGTQIAKPESRFRRIFPVPPSLVGRNAVEISISVDRTFRDSAGRDLGLVFGTIAFGNNAALAPQ